MYPKGVLYQILIQIWTSVAITITNVDRTGEKWRKLRSMHGKQLAPANVYAYCPGFQAAGKRFVRNVNLQKNHDGYINDLRQLIVYWAFEGNYITVHKPL